jgi:hypothetical protein
MNSKTITHSTFGIMTNWEHKLDIVTKDKSSQRKDHILHTYNYYQRTRVDVCVCLYQHATIQCNPMPWWPINCSPFILFISVKLMINSIDGISHYNQHLLMFNGHESHIIFEIVQQVNNGVWICSPYWPTPFMNSNFLMQVCSSHSKFHSTSFKIFGLWPTNTNLHGRRIWHNEYHWHCKNPW